MKLWYRLKTRFDPKRHTFELEEADMLLAMELGWVEKFMGGYITTERGEEEMTSILNKFIKNDFENTVYKEDQDATRNA